MIPFNTLSSEIVQAPFQYPSNLITDTLLEDYEMGGAAIQDTSQGHQVTAWYGRVDALSGDVILRTYPVGTEQVVWNQSDIFEFSFAFDQNMRWVVVCTLTDGTTLLRWYDPTAASYVTSVFTGINSCRVTLDDSREQQIQFGATDVIFTYFKTSNGDLCFRAQRDRYLVEYVLNDAMPTNLLITNFGMSNVNRLQWRARVRTFTEVLPWLL